jgi:predicted ATPase/class 3 adenylate cyclase
MMQVVQRDLPSGTVTFLFTDVEGSTRLLQEAGAEAYAGALAEHRRVIREAVATHGGVEVDTQGDAFFIAFPTAPGALGAAAEAYSGLAGGSIRVRMGLHSGTPLVTAEGYVGEDVHRAARIAASGHGGQILVSASTAALVGSEQLRDLGLHRLKDLSAPVRIFQLGDADFPPLKSLHQTNLPIASTPFVGRERELPEIVQLLSQDDVRLLTLTGPGGTGKTRLAMQAAAILSERYPQGTWWVPLAALRESELVLETAAQVVGAKDGLAEYIGDRAMLLLFDNFEQVVDAATDVAELLTACPNLELLVTSRESLRVTGEQEYAVPPLVHEEGVGFFLARARALKPDFEVDDNVSEICRRLDDLPLALELAAARVKALTSAQILERLEHRLPLLTGGARDLPERQRTLRATIAWSYDLLTTDEQRLFTRLAVFAGGCTLEAAEQVAEADLDTIQSLVDKSLVRHTDDRLWMLETVREYAGGRLDESPDADQVRGRHAAHFLALAEDAEPKLPADRRDLLERLQQEHDNLRVALDRAQSTGETQLALRLSGALARFWMSTGQSTEGRRRLESAVAADERPTAARAKALTGASMLAEDHETAKARAEEALALLRDLDDAWGTAAALLALGSAYSATDMNKARELYEESARGFLAVGDEHYALIVNRGLAWVYINLGKRERGRELHEENLRLARALSNERIEAITLGALAMHAVEEGEVERALPMLEESHRLHLKLNDPFQTACDVCRFASLLAATGHEQTATRILSSADALADDAGADLRSWDPEFINSIIGTIRERVDEDAFAKAWEEGRSLSADRAVALALDELG